MLHWRRFQLGSARLSANFSLIRALKRAARTQPALAICLMLAFQAADRSNFSKSCKISNFAMAARKMTIRPLSAPTPCRATGLQSFVTAMSATLLGTHPAMRACSASFCGSKQNCQAILPPRAGPCSIIPPATKAFALAMRGPMPITRMPRSNKRWQRRIA